jgi:hypothetical protein
VKLRGGSRELAHRPPIKDCLRKTSFRLWMPLKYISLLLLAILRCGIETLSSMFFRILSKIDLFKGDVAQWLSTSSQRRTGLFPVKWSGHGHRSTMKVWTEEEFSSNLGAIVGNLSFLLVWMFALLVIGRTAGGRPLGV